MTGLVVNEVCVDSATIVEVGGVVDLSTAGQLSTRLTQLLTEHVSHLIVDLAEVSFLDSTGLTALVGAEKAAAAVGAELTLVGLTPMVVQLFEITGLDQYLKVLPDQQAALERISPR